MSFPVVNATAFTQRDKRSASPSIVSGHRTDLHPDRAQVCSARLYPGRRHPQTRPVCVAIDHCRHRRWMFWRRAVWQDCPRCSGRPEGRRCSVKQKAQAAMYRGLCARKFPASLPSPRKLSSWPSLCFPRHSTAKSTGVSRSKSVALRPHAPDLTLSLASWPAPACDGARAVFREYGARGSSPSRS